MPTKPDASISSTGRKYHLRCATIANTDIALHLSAGSRYVTAGDVMDGEGQPPGTFWIGGRLVAVRTVDNEVVVFCSSSSILGENMLGIGDFVTEPSN